MTQIITPSPLTAEAFAPYGDVIVPRGKARMINQGQCARYHALAMPEILEGETGISLFDAEARELPLELDMVERHPLGSQAFLPLNGAAYLVVVAEDRNGTPDEIRAFVAGPEQGINLHRNVWHGVLTPLGQRGLFAVIDRIGEGANLEEHWFESRPMIATAPD